MNPEDYRPDYHPSYRWTRHSARAIRQGFKGCTRCKKKKPIEEFNVRCRHDRKVKNIKSHCKKCGVTLRRQYKANEPAEKRKEQYKRWYEKNREHLKEKNRKRYKYRKEEQQKYLRHQYKAKLLEQSKNILDQDECDICGRDGAKHFWRNTGGRDFESFLVLHKKCKQQAVEEGWITPKSMVRPKRQLTMEKPKKRGKK